MTWSAEDWFDRLKQAGGMIRVDAGSMYPAPGPLTDECKGIWGEVQGPDNRDKWQQAENHVRSLAGKLVGWDDL